MSWSNWSVSAAVHYFSCEISQPTHQSNIINASLHKKLNSESCTCRFSGATCGLALVFVFPALVHMISLKRRGLLRWPSVLFHSALILLGVANLVAQFLM